MRHFQVMPVILPAPSVVWQTLLASTGTLVELLHSDSALDGLTVALLVVGPERLPKVARTAGMWLGRGRRFIRNVRDDIEREIKADELKQGFRNPSDACKPHTFWHWMNGHVTRESITRDLEDMKRIGLGGFMLWNTHEGIPKGPVKYASQQWWELLEHTMSEAEEILLGESWGNECSHGRQLLPGDSGGDGVYYARVKKHA